jgi:hypothetical protein
MKIRLLQTSAHRLTAVKKITKLAAIAMLGSIIFNNKAGGCSKKWTEVFLLLKMVLS